MKFNNNIKLKTDKIKVDIGNNGPKIMDLLFAKHFTCETTANFINGKYLYIELCTKWFVILNYKEQFEIITTSFQKITLSDLYNIIKGNYEIQ